jgi:hypothetical protein
MTLTTGHCCSEGWNVDISASSPFSRKWRNPTAEPRVGRDKIPELAARLKAIDAMYRVVLECSGISSDEGHTAALDIAKNFAEHRPHHVNVTCSFADGKLTLVADNDFDPKGLALMDEFLRLPLRIHIGRTR